MSFASEKDNRLKQKLLSSLVNKNSWLKFHVSSVCAFSCFDLCGHMTFTASGTGDIEPCKWKGILNVNTLQLEQEPQQLEGKDTPAAC